MQSPDITSFVSDQANRNAPGVVAQRVGINTNRGPISYMPTPGTKEWTIGYQAGRTLPNAAISRGMLHPLRPIIDNLGTSNGASALAGAGIGGALGAGASLLNGGNVGRGTAVGAGMGATGMLLLSLFAQNRLKNTRWSQAPLPPQPGRVKEAFYAVQPEATQDIQSKVMQDGALAYMDKTTLLQYVNQLSVDQKMNLSRLIGPAAGAGIGAVIARYLLGLGIGGTALLALTGAAVGRQFSGTHNAYGQSVDTRHDMFGQPRFV
jgi:hypothetical protein